MDDGAQELVFIHTHCKTCCDDIADLNKDINKNLTLALERLLKIEKENKELSLEQKITFTKILLDNYEREGGKPYDNE
jgi:hypothetical protein